MAEAVSVTSGAAAWRARPPTSVIPPYRFAIVEENVYRGAYPVERNFPYLQTY